MGPASGKGEAAGLGRVERRVRLVLQESWSPRKVAAATQPQVVRGLSNCQRRGETRSFILEASQFLLWMASYMVVLFVEIAN